MSPKEKTTHIGSTMPFSMGQLMIVSELSQNGNSSVPFPLTDFSYPKTK